MVRIFIALGILTFAKAAPSFISKMFGISDMAGSFKDAGNMLKTAAFTAAGAGLAVGAAGIGVGRNVMAAKAGGLGAKGVLAAGLRGTAGIFGAGLRGAGGGMKGNVMAGAKGTWAAGSARNDLYRQGIGVGAQMKAGFLGGMLVGKKDKEVEDAYEDLSKQRSELDKELESDIINKGQGNYRIDTSKYINDGENKYADSLSGEYTQERAKGLCDDIDGMSLQEMNNMIQSGKTADGSRDLSAEERSFYSRIYADELNNAKASRISEVMADQTQNATAAAMIKKYDRTVDNYANKLGSKTDDKDGDHSYNFTSISKMSDVAAGDGSAYKKTKVTDAMNTFKNSATRDRNRQLEQIVKNKNGGK